MTVGDDVDAFVSLRQALARQGMSVSMAWNTKQAADLLPVVRPEVLVLDLDLFEQDGAGFIARLAACDPAPTLVLIVGNNNPTPAFAAVLTDPAHDSRAISLHTLLRRMAAARVPVRSDCMTVALEANRSGPGRDA